MLHKALENAVKWGLVSRNVTKLVTKPRMERYEGTVLTVEQAKRLLDAAQGSRLESLLVVALATGRRRGELLALHWDDVDLKKGVVYVRRTMSHISGHSSIVMTMNIYSHVLPSMQQEAAERIDNMFK